MQQCLRHCQHAGTQSTPVSTESTRRYLVGFRSTICEPWGLCPAQGWWLCKSQKAWDSSTLVYPIHLCIDGDCSVPGATSATVRRVDAVAHHARERIERRVGIRRSTCKRAVLYASTALWTRRRHVARHQLCDHRDGTAGTCNRRPRKLLTCLHAADGPALPKRLRAHHLCVCARACVCTYPPTTWRSQTKDYTHSNPGKPPSSASYMCGRCGGGPPQGQQTPPRSRSHSSRREARSSQKAHTSRLACLLP